MTWNEVNLDNGKVASTLQTMLNPLCTNSHLKCLILCNVQARAASFWDLCGIPPDANTLRLGDLSNEGSERERCVEHGGEVR